LKNLSIYTTKQINADTCIQFIFESVGLKKIIKIIEYTPITFIGGRTVYNLGFGDYDVVNQTFIDDVNSNNGDVYTVFNTVLNTVPLFFKSHPEAVIIVSGSDGCETFIKDCRQTCKKSCKSYCKNFQRRIKAYSYYINKNFQDLCEDYIFFGRNNLTENKFITYNQNDDYQDILVYKKIKSKFVLNT
jgi:hypothetical protein